MRFESANFEGFAGLEGRRPLGPRLNLIVGPNESGKSRLVNGLLYGLCGRVKKRGRGADPTERYRAWASRRDAPFRVSVALRLDNGHLLEVHQNLDEPSRSRVIDMDLGRELTSELMVDRAPDASRLLGLERDVVPRTLLVQQGELLSVRDGADAMQMLLQRAATSGALDETANAALARLDAFRSERIGTEHASSKRPLRATRELETTTRRALDELRALHSSLSQERAGLVQRRAELVALEQERKRAKGRELFDERQRLERLLRRLDQLEAELADAEAAAAVALPEVGPGELDALAQRIATLRGWRPPSAPSTPSPDTIEAELEALPPWPEGDRAPRPELVRMHEDLRVARAALEQHRAQTVVEQAPPSGLEPHVLRGHARQLEQPPPVVPEVDPGLDPRGPRTLAAVLLGVGLLGLGLGAALTLWLVLALGLVVMAGGAYSAMVARRRHRAGEAKLAERRAAEADLTLYRQRRAEIERELHAHGVAPADAAGALAEARRYEEALDGARLHRHWRERLDSLENRSIELERAMVTALESVGAPTFSAYVAACDERRRQETEARRRVDLERLLATSRREHEDHEGSLARHRASIAALDGLAERLGVPGLVIAPEAAIPDAVFESLEAHLERLRERDAARQRARALAAERMTLLGQDDRGSLARRLAALDEQVGADEPEAARGSGRAVSSLELDARIAELQRSVAQQEAALNERLRGLPSVAEAEEAHELATRAHARIRRLERLVALTIENLQVARDTIHRDIAPRLSAALSKVVPRLTGGRWERARIAVDDLSVAVFRDHEWRPAHELSCGTAEQIYLALRVTLATELASSGESAPLILDDVLVHADEARVEELLGWLEELSERHQVILTTADERLVPWAERAGATIHRLP